MLTNNVYNRENIYVRGKVKESVEAKKQRLSGNLRTGQLINGVIKWEDGEEETYVYRRIQKKY